MRPDTLLYGATIGFFVGVAAQQLVASPLALALFALVLASALFSYWLLVRTPLVLLALVALLSFGFGAARMGYAEYRVEQARTAFDTAASQETLRGLVVDEVVEKEVTKQFTVALDETRVRVIADRHTDVRYGDTVELAGSVEAPEPFETDTGRLFNYPQYLAARGITHQLFRPEVTVLERGGGFFVKRALLSLKAAFVERIGAAVPEPHVSLLGGLVIGAQEAMGEELLDAFRVTGLIHIVVLSGYNVTIVAESIMRLLGFLSARLRAVVGALAIVLFALLTGASATIVRASGMALLVILARVTARTYDVLRALAVMALVMVLVDPYVLLFDPSFQLSFLATLGLIFVVPLLERLIPVAKRLATMRSFVLATLATQLFVLPLLLFTVGNLSTVALFVNVLVLPVVPTVMLFGFLTGAAGFVSGALALPLGFVSYALLGYVLKVVEWFSVLPFASVHFEHFPLWGVLLLYGLYAAVLAALARASGKPPRTTS